MLFRGAPTFGKRTGRGIFREHLRQFSEEE